MSAQRRAAKRGRVAGELLDSRASGLKPMHSSPPSTAGSPKTLIPSTCKTRGHCLKRSSGKGTGSSHCHRTADVMVMIFWLPQAEAELEQMA
jgi:hypothetical protein